jgi:hypothetical protein
MIICFFLFIIIVQPTFLIYKVYIIWKVINLILIMKSKYKNNYLNEF